MARAVFVSFRIYSSLPQARWVNPFLCFLFFPFQVSHVRAERDAMAAAENPWVVGLHYSFQDDRNLCV